MPVNIIEIKAKCVDAAQIRTLLQANKAAFKGIDHQIDTYFKAPIGRLKLREGNIENTLIHYNRPNQAGPKNSQVTYRRLPPNSDLKDVLAAAMGILTVVDKKRGIYFIDNVKFHLDEVKNLGTFVEIEAIDETGEIGIEKLKEQCAYYMALFAIQSSDLIDVSYSDLMMETENG
ncbi:MAG: class IV adenylate cyclase [Saprospiraceae bacterium]